jgi:hypothetical protein
MARIYPSNPDFKTKGEQLICTVLQGCLDGTWSIFYEPTIGDAHPDFVLFHPERGVMVLEVKDYTPPTIVGIAPDMWEIRVNGECMNVTSPFKQAWTYTHKLQDLFMKNKLLVHEAGRYKGRLIFPVSFACVFPNITKNDGKKLNFNRVVQQDRVLYKEDICESTGTFILRRLEELMTSHFIPEPMSHCQQDAVVGLLYPTYSDIEKVSESIAVYSTEEHSGNPAKNEAFTSSGIQLFLNHWKSKTRPNKEQIQIIQRAVTLRKFHDRVEEMIFVVNECVHLQSTNLAQSADIYVVVPNSAAFELALQVFNDMHVGIEYRPKIIELSTMGNATSRLFHTSFLTGINSLEPETRRMAILQVLNNTSHKAYLSWSGSSPVTDSLLAILS